MKKLILMLILVITISTPLYADNYSGYFKAKLTFYCPSAGGINCGKDKNTTAFMSKPKSKRTVAISRSLYKKGIKKGTKIHIEGIGIRIVEDLMGKSIKGDQIDICVSSVKKAIQLGVKKNVKIYIISEE